MTIPTFRGLPADVVRGAGIERVDAARAWLLPYFGEDGQLLRNRWRADNGDVWWGPDLAGGRVYPYGLEHLARADDHDVVYISEGESDCLALRTLGCIAVGCPGATAWRSHWSTFFERFAEIVAIGDGDDAGLDFVWRVRRSIPRTAVVTCPPGQDVRSLIQTVPVALLDRLLADARSLRRLEDSVLASPTLTDFYRRSNHMENAA